MEKRSIPAEKIVNLRITGKLQTTQKQVPKAFFHSKKVNWNEQNIQVTMWIPKNDHRYKPPKVSLTLEIGGEKVRIYAEDVQQLEELMKQMYEMVLQYAPTMSKIHLEEKRKYYETKRAIETAQKNN